ncbi:MAG: DoxX family protein [Acidobacteriia bacterium]|nr:DoxX family protein [Terriglobia bacterium]
MNVALWVMQTILAFGFVFGGLNKIVQPKEKLAEKFRWFWVNDFSAGAVKLIGVAEVAGGIGIVLPTLLNIAPLLTPIAGISLAILMLGALVVHLRRKENSEAVAPLVLVFVFLSIAYGRFTY